VRGAATPAAADTAQLAKAALRRLALQRLEPTPENYARAWADEGGAAASLLPEGARALVQHLLQRGCAEPARRAEVAAHVAQARWDEALRLLDGAATPADGAAAWAALIERVARGLERGGRQWTSARRKESLHRVLDGSRHDAQRLQQRLQQLLASWDQDAAPSAVEPVAADEAATTPPPALALPPTDELAQRSAPPVTTSASPAAVLPAAALGWPTVVDELGTTLRAALPAAEPRAAALADELARVADRIARDGATAPIVGDVAALCERSRRWLAHRQHLVDELAALCRALTAGLAELAEDASWAQGQVRALEAHFDAGLGPRTVKAAGELLERTRARQRELRRERDQARDALRVVIADLLAQLGHLDAAAGRYGERLGRYDDAIRDAASVDQLADVVQQMLRDNRDVRADVQATRQRLADEHARAAALEARVRALEGELRRVSDELTTDALTEVANRRGLLQAFDAECARLARTDGEMRLAIGLLDIDNFKKLNDTLGHAAGDQALKALAQRVGELLRPADTIGRWGGEEFVVLLPATGDDEAQQVLARLQRALTASLFLHEGREVFVTFSAGVTAWRPGEPIDAALERADEALYEAKRTGKNRTCVA
jgi:diguanylate cyclase